MAVESEKNLSSQPIILSAQDLHDDASVDPVYHAKARVVNQALQKIGMGKYQVRVTITWHLKLSNYINLVAVICRRRFWMVFVSDYPCQFLRVLISYLARLSDSVWPVSFTF